MAKYNRKENEDLARERLRAFWHGESIDRPCLHITVVDPSHEPTPWDGAPGMCKENDWSPEWFAWRAANLLRSTTFLAEAMPAFVLDWGNLLTTVGVLAGADYEYQGDSAWFVELPDLWDRDLPAFSRTDPVVLAWERIYRKVADTMGTDGFPVPPIMLDGMTNLSMFRTPRQLCIDLLDSPEYVRAWSDALTTIYIACYEHFYQLLSDWGYGEGQSWLGAMAEGRVEAVQCDFAVMLSPAMFEQFVMPDLVRVTEHMDYSLYHLDGTVQMRFLDQLATLPKLNGIQWNPEPPANPPTRWLEAFHEIRKRDLILHINCATVDEAVIITREIGPDGLLFKLPPFATRLEAENAIASIEKASR